MKLVPFVISSRDSLYPLMEVNGPYLTLYYDPAEYSQVFWIGEMLLHPQKFAESLLFATWQGEFDFKKPAFLESRFIEREDSEHDDLHLWDVTKERKHQHFKFKKDITFKMLSGFFDAVLRIQNSKKLRSFLKNEGQAMAKEIGMDISPYFDITKDIVAPDVKTKIESKIAEVGNQAPKSKPVAPTVNTNGFFVTPKYDSLASASAGNVLGATETAYNFASPAIWIAVPLVTALVFLVRNCVRSRPKASQAQNDARRENGGRLLRMN